MKTNNFKPILFSTPMVQAILEGRKTQTRRVIKYSKTITEPQIGFSMFTDNGEFEVRGIHENGQYGSSFFKLKYKVGDIIWVRETWRGIEQETGGYRFEYKATEKINTIDKWKPSIFMPKKACRIFLKIKRISIERLNNISDKDAIKEGIIELSQSSSQLATNGKLYLNYLKKKELFNEGLTAKDSYKTLWQKINGKKSWEKNPYVFIYEFERTDVSFACS